MTESVLNKVGAGLVGNLIKNTVPSSAAESFNGYQ